MNQRARSCSVFGLGIPGASLSVVKTVVARATVGSNPKPTS